MQSRLSHDGVAHNTKLNDENLIFEKCDKHVYEVQTSQSAVEEPLYAEMHEVKTPRSNSTYVEMHEVRSNVEDSTYVEMRSNVEDSTYVEMHEVQIPHSNVKNSLYMEFNEQAYTNTP